MLICRNKTRGSHAGGPASGRRFQVVVEEAKPLNQPVDACAQARDEARSCSAFRRGCVTEIVRLPRIHEKSVHPGAPVAHSGAVTRRHLVTSLIAHQSYAPVDSHAIE
jgi:hypothetical protein